MFLTFKNLNILVLSVIFSYTHITGQDTLTVIDVDSNIYHTVTVRDQVWMKENLKTTRYNDSTAIPYIKDDNEWMALKSPGYTWYEYDKENKDIYGALYNWYAVNTNKLCPVGWHVPTDDEWNMLEIYLGMQPYEAQNISYRGTSKAFKLKATGTVQESTGLWHTPNEGATNETGFSAIPGGFIYYNDGYSYGLGSYGFWWASEEFNKPDAWYRLLYYHSAYMSRSTYNKGYGFSVRCLKD